MFRTGYVMHVYFESVAVCIDMLASEACFVLFRLHFFRLSLALAYTLCRNTIRETRRYKKDKTKKTEANVNVNRQQSLVPLCSLHRFNIYYCCSTSVLHSGCPEVPRPFFCSRFSRFSRSTSTVFFLFESF